MELIDDLRFHLSDEILNSEDTNDGVLIPMGLYVVWAAERGLFSDEFMPEARGFLEEVARGELTCRDVVDFEFDGKLFSTQFSESGLRFTTEYYLKDQYINDLKEEFSELGSIYEIPDTESSRIRASKFLDRRFKEFQSTK